MAEELEQLIKKIQAEGIAVAEQKAKDIVDAAESRSADILKKAEAEAGRIIENAKEETAKMIQGGEVALRQAGRDFIIGLRKEIDGMLNRVIREHTGEALNAKNLSEIIGALVKARASEKGAVDIEVILSEKDLEALGDSFVSGLKSEIKKGVSFKSSASIRAGFSISYDGGESRFDFTDEALAEYLGARLRPRLAELLKESAEINK